MCQIPASCNHTFPYWSVIPPSHCPQCGACLHAASPWPTPIYPHPWGRRWPYYTTITSSSTTSAPFYK